MELYVNLNTQINVEVCRCCCYVKQILLSCMHTCLGSTFVASFDTNPRVLKTIDRRHLVESAFSIQNLYYKDTMLNGCLNTVNGNLQAGFQALC